MGTFVTENLFPPLNVVSLTTLPHFLFSLVRSFGFKELDISYIQVTLNSRIKYVQ
jgi:hypothetical protein